MVGVSEPVSLLGSWCGVANLSLIEAEKKFLDAVDQRQDLTVVQEEDGKSQGARGPSSMAVLPYGSIASIKSRKAGPCA